MCLDSSLMGMGSGWYQTSADDDLRNKFFDLQKLLHGMAPNLVADDKFVWCSTNSNGFPVKNNYNKLLCSCDVSYNLDNKLLKELL